jgi:hypothetical protein
MWILFIQRISEDSHLRVWYNGCFVILRERVWCASAESNDGICGLKVRSFYPPKKVLGLILRWITAHWGE